MADERRFYEAEASGTRRSAPAALRNREPIADVLEEWLPRSGMVLELASGTGEHVVYFAGRFEKLKWQPSDIHADALASIAAWREETKLPNVRAPLVIDAAAPKWPIDQADAVLSIKMDSDSCDQQKTAEKGGFDVVLNLNMVHISPWSAGLGLLDGAARVLKRGGALILYGPWLQTGVETAPSNLAFDQQLRQRDPAWGLRRVEDFDAAATERGFRLEQTRAMPANNLMLLFRLAD
jgi:SAM-dependent methyltransferase